VFAHVCRYCPTRSRSQRVVTIVPQRIVVDDSTLTRLGLMRSTSPPARSAGSRPGKRKGHIDRASTRCAARTIAPRRSIEETVVAEPPVQDFITESPVSGTAGGEREVTSLVSEYSFRAVEPDQLAEIVHSVT